MRNRQKLLAWLEDALGVLCETLAELTDRAALEQFRTSICESVDGVLLSLVDAMESDDAMSWEFARQLTGERGEMMRKLREQFLELDPPLPKPDLIKVLLITNSVEETFFLLSKMERNSIPPTGPTSMCLTSDRSLFVRLVAISCGLHPIGIKRSTAKPTSPCPEAQR